jgi:hypothetical protein
VAATGPGPFPGLVGAVQGALSKEPSDLADEMEAHLQQRMSGWRKTQSLLSLAKVERDTLM